MVVTRSHLRPQIQPRVSVKDILARVNLKQAAPTKVNRRSARGKDRTRTRFYPPRPTDRKKAVKKVKEDYRRILKVFGYRPLLSGGADLKTSTERLRILIWPKRRTRQRKVYNETITSDKLDPLSPKTMQFYMDLHIPTLPSRSKTWSLQRRLTYLRWSIKLRPHAIDRGYVEFNDINHGDKPVHIPLSEYTRDGNPPLVAPPRKGVDAALLKERFRLHHRLLDSVPQIPADWKPIEGISLSTLYHEQGTSNSELHKEAPKQLEDLLKVFTSSKAFTPSISSRSPTAEIQPLPSSTKTQSPDAVDMEVNKGSQKTIQVVYTTAGDREIVTTGLSSTRYALISYNSGSNGDPFFRQDWEMLVTMEPSVFGWKYKDSDNLQQRDRDRQAGNIAVNNNSANWDVRTYGAIARFMSVYFLREEGAIKGELDFRAMVGRRIADLISTDALPAYWSVCRHAFAIASSLIAHSSLPLRRSLPASYSHHAPIMDVACQPTFSELPWDSVIQPVLLIAQYNSGDERSTVERIAEAFYPTIVLFILYYLDLRTSVDELMPKWMVLYGIIYNEEGFSIQEYFPVLRFRPESGSTQDPSFSWGASAEDAVDFGDSFSSPPYDRSASIAALLRIRSHARGVLRKFQEWNSYKRCIQPILS